MNISIYIPNSLMEHFESYVKNNGTTRNAAIRKAVELLLKKEKEATWGAWMNNFKSDSAYQPAESYRGELTSPSDNIL